MTDIKKPGSGSAHGLARGLTNYGDREFSRYLRRSFASSMGYSREMLDKPIVGIAQSGSGFNNCHRNFPELIEAVKRGVLAAGALPVEFPTISLGEVFLNPTSLKFRNLMSMDVEEMVRAQPMDAVVLVGGCDKTVPAQLMGAASVDLPAIQLVAGPMSTARFHGERLGACTDCRRFWQSYRAGRVDADEINEIEKRLASTAGTCAVMGTASTMASLAEALGMMPPMSAAIPAVDADRLRMAEETGRIAVSLIGDDTRRPSRIMTEKAFENALRVLLALGGSTNAVIHLAAIMGRLGYKFDLDKLNAFSETTPVLVDLKPTGSAYMEDLHYAGGIPAVMRELRHLIHLDCPTVTGQTVGERIRLAEIAGQNQGAVERLRQQMLQVLVVAGECFKDRVAAGQDARDQPVAAMCRKTFGPALVREADERPTEAAENEPGVAGVQLELRELEADEVGRLLQLLLLLGRRGPIVGRVSIVRRCVIVVIVVIVVHFSLLFSGLFFPFGAGCLGCAREI
jgi:dihydroxy-acid dehydratase